MKAQIAVIPGDGIGLEVTSQAVGILEEIARIKGHEFRFSTYSAGGCAIDEFGRPLPEKTIRGCQACDAVLLGAVGGPKWDHLEGSERPEAALLGLRKILGLYANIRPAVLYEPLKSACPLRPDIAAKGIDICVVRELTGGIYFGKRGRLDGPEGPEAFDTESISRNEVLRIARTAFEIALKRRKKVTSIDKANVLESSRFWRDTVCQTAVLYPDVELEHMYVDNASMQLIRAPQQFDVVLANNMFGDILSDEAGMITGSLGILPSASLGEARRGMYEPVHGSAPDIAGRDKANPIAAVLSAALLLRHSLDLEEEALLIEKAVIDVLKSGFRTADIMNGEQSSVGTSEMGGLIRESIGRRARNRNQEKE